MIEKPERRLLMRNREIAAGEAERRHGAQRRFQPAGLDRQRRVAALDPILREPVIMDFRRARMRDRPAHDSGENKAMAVRHVLVSSSRVRGDGKSGAAKLDERGFIRRLLAQRVDSREPWTPPRRSDQRVERRARPGDDRLDRAVAPVARPAGEIERERLADEKGAIADALHPAFDEKADDLPIAHD